MKRKGSPGESARNAELPSLVDFIVCVFVGLALFLTLVTLPPALDAIGVPVAGLAILLGIDRIPDMMRTGVNLLGQISAAVLVDRWTGAERSG